MWINRQEQLTHPIEVFTEVLNKLFTWEKNSSNIQLQRPDCAFLSTLWPKTGGFHVLLWWLSASSTVYPPFFSCTVKAQRFLVYCCCRRLRLHLLPYVNGNGKPFVGKLNSQKVAPANNIICRSNYMRSTEPCSCCSGVSTKYTVCILIFFLNEHNSNLKPKSGKKKKWKCLNRSVKFIISLSSFKEMRASHALLL